MGLGVRIPTVTLHMTELFDPTVEQLYSIFTVKDVTSQARAPSADVGRKCATKNWSWFLVSQIAMFL